MGAYLNLTSLPWLRHSGAGSQRAIMSRHRLVGRSGWGVAGGTARALW